MRIIKVQSILFSSISKMKMTRPEVPVTTIFTDECLKQIEHLNWCVKNKPYPKRCDVQLENLTKHCTKVFEKLTI